MESNLGEKPHYLDDQNESLDLDPSRIGGFTLKETIQEKEEISEAGDFANEQDANQSFSSNASINSSKARRHNFVPVAEML